VELQLRSYSYCYLLLLFFLNDEIVAREDEHSIHVDVKCCLLVSELPSFVQLPSQSSLP